MTVKYPALVQSVEDFLKVEYDFLIAGGGQSGCVLAGRLTEDPNITVGVIEAGKSHLDDPLVDIPAAFPQQLGNDNYQWTFYTEPQTANEALVHQHPRGKGLGGSSAINHGMYVRGSSGDYDNWATLVNDDGWSAEKLKPYARKHQTIEPLDPAITRKDTMAFVGDNHGTNGPIKTSFNAKIFPIEHDSIDAAYELTGLKDKPLDPWGGDHIGFYNTLGAVSRSGHDKGTRSYAGSGYIKPNSKRPNLRVLCESTVNKILLEGDKAIGLEISRNGRTHNVHAKKEVIVSCGTYLSPQLLELSGIGDPEVLKAAGVEPKIALPGVGNNLQDHIITGANYNVRPEVETMVPYGAPDAVEAAEKEYKESQTGIFTMICSCQGFFPYKILATKEQLSATIEEVKAEAMNEFQRKQSDILARELNADNAANLQFLNLPVKVNLTGAVKDQTAVFIPYDPNVPAGVNLQIALQYPASRGYVHIKSSDPSDLPTINPRYLSNEADVDLLTVGLQFLERLARSPKMRGQLTERTFPRPELDLSKYEDARKAVHEFIHTEYHPIGTCAMGDVVDSRLRVKGVKGLRVIDASVFPIHVSGNIQGTVYTVAEKGADLVKEDWGIRT